ncbi:MAG TPA: hypothetical protein VLD18_08250 [Verrucomicrobiae bacterium]|nr:hypothetical protein [Verrucomicrobiae bacterium]
MKNKTLIQTGLLMLAFTVGVFKAQALTPGPTIIRECPQCKKPLMQFTIGSGNSRGARLWTDGKMDAPGMPLWSGLGKCPHCQELFWIADAKKLGEIGWTTLVASPEDTARWEKAPQIATPTEADHLLAAEAKDVSHQHEEQARRWAWWVANDAIRANPGPRYTWSGPRRQNLEKLSLLLDDQKECDVVQKAEIARELGQFEVCLKFLDREFGQDCDESFVAFIRKLANEKKTNVAVLPQG